MTEAHNAKRSTLKAAFLPVLPIWLLCVLVVASPAGAADVDTTGLWTGSQIVQINQAKGEIVLETQSGQKFTGTLAGNTIELRHKLNRSTVKKSLPPAIQQQVLDRGVEVLIHGRLASDGQVIEIDLVDKDIKWKKGDDGIERITSLDDLKSHLTLRRGVVHWHEPMETAGNRVTLEGPQEVSGRATFDRPIAALKYQKKGNAEVALTSPGSNLAKNIEKLELKNLIGPSRAVVSYSREQLQFSFDNDRSETVIKLDLDKLLHDLSTGVNLNVVEATVTLRLNAANGTVVVKTANLLHVLQQKLMVFLPGVLGSVLHVELNRPPFADFTKTADCDRLTTKDLKDACTKCLRLPSGQEKNDCLHGEDVEAYPRMSLGVVPEGAGSWGVQYLKFLENGRNGEPLPGNEATRIDLFRSYGVNSGATINTIPVASSVGRFFVAVSLVYGVEELDSVKEPVSHPKLSVNGAPMPYYVFQPWPYDWRGRLEQQVDRLMGADNGAGQVDAPYANPPTLASLIRVKKTKYLFLDDKVAVIGHSTGGLIIRGLLIRDGVDKYVDRAAFIDVPFYGAPKAYFVYLTGDMGVPFLGNEQMMMLAPDMPILYYLAPTKYYPQPVAKVGGNPRYRLHLDAGDIMRDLLEAARNNRLYPQSGPLAKDWNNDLDFAADLYHGAIHNFPIKIDLKNCLVFVSTAEAKTIGAVRVGANGVEYDSVPGDGTVPLVSQIGDFADKAEVERRPIPGSPEHTMAPNREYVWQEIIRKLIVFPSPP
jgi:hypothetical protein